MMGRLKSDQDQLFYEFHLRDAVPEDHMVRKIDAALDLSWLRSELTPHYSSIGRPSIDPEMIRMLIVGYVFAIRSDRLICREVNAPGAFICLLKGANFGKQRRDRRRAFGSAVRRGELPGPTLLISHASHRLCVDRIMAAARSPMITHGAIVLPVATLGMTDPSATRSLSIP
jgi:hypothetical protein